MDGAVGGGAALLGAPRRRPHHTLRHLQARGFPAPFTGPLCSVDARAAVEGDSSVGDPKAEESALFINVERDKACLLPPPDRSANNPSSGSPQTSDGIWVADSGTGTRS